MVIGNVYKCPSCRGPAFGCLLDRPCDKCRNDKPDHWVLKEIDQTSLGESLLDALKEASQESKIPIWSLVIDDMQKRDILGRSRYGVPLTANNGRDALLDAYEEALDLAVYLKQAIVERDEKS